MAKRTFWMVVLMTAVALPVAGCGTDAQGNTIGTVVIGVDAIAPQPFITNSPTPFTITGSNFSNAAGPDCIVRFTADGGLTPFAGGTSAFVEVPGVIDDDTMVTGVTPVFTFPGILDAFVTVILPSTAAGTSATPIAQFIGIQVDAFAPPTIFTDAQTAFNVTGNGFGPIGLSCTVIFNATAGTPFLNGTAATLMTTGTVNSLTDISGFAPIAGVSSIVDCTITVVLDNLPGAPSATSALPLMQFLPPVVTSTLPPQVESEIPTAVTIIGDGFGPIAGTASVQITADAGTPFLNGTAASLTVVGTITSSTTIDITSPIFQTPVDAPCNIDVTLPSGAMGGSAAPVLTVLTPTVTASSLANVPSEIPTAITITGTGFAPNASAPTVRFRAAAGTPFLGGTATFLDVTGTVVNSTTITCTSPRAGVSAGTPCNIGVFMTTGIVEVLSAAPIVTFDPPTITSTAPTMVESEIPETVTFTGTGFGSATGTCTVTFEAAAGTPFVLGTAGSLAVVGTVVNPTTITCTSPIAGVQADALSNIRLTFPTLAVALANNQITFKTPTVTASSLAVVPSEIPTAITITGTGFAGGVPTVRFASAGSPFLGGSASFLDVTGTLINPTTVVCTTPRAGVSGAALSTIQVFMTGGLSPISAGTLITFDPPTIASLSPTMVESEIPQTVTITGTGFGSATGLVNVTLAGAGTPFSLGTIASLTVTGTIVNPTTITFTSPISGVLADLNADVTLTFATGASATSAAALLIKTPTVTASSLASVDSENPTLITITGTGFAGGTPTVRFANATAPYAGGTASTIDATGVTLVNATTITCTTPRAGVNVNAGSTIQVLLTGGLTPISAGPLLTFIAPTTVSCAPTFVDAGVASLVTVTGTGYYAPGTVTMRFTAATGTPFAGSATLDVTGATVVNPTTVTATTPILALANKAECTVGIIFASGAAPTSGPDCVTFEVPPDAVDDTYTADGNVELVVNAANGLILGTGTDSDPDGDPITVSAFDNPSVNGGDVSVAADGSFTYNPFPGFEGVDTFTYTISDGFLTDTATVTVTVSGMVWFIDNNAVAAGDGRFTSPFNTLAGFTASVLDQAGDVIFVYSSATDYTGNIVLLGTQTLLGQGVALNHPGTTGTDPLVVASTNPTLDSAAGTTVSLASGNIIRGLNIDSTNGAALTGGAVGSLSIDTVGINATGGAGIDINGSGTLAVTFTSVASTNSSSNGIRLGGVGGTFTVSGATTSTNPSATGISISGGSPTVSLSSFTTTTSGSNGISIFTPTGGSFTVSGATTITSSSANGMGIEFTPAGYDINFSTVTISTPLDDGILLNACAGTFDVTGNCSITTPGNSVGTPTTDHGVDIDGGGIAVTFADLDVSDSTGHGVEISGTSGAISITGDLGVGPESSDIHNNDDVGIHCTDCTGTLTLVDLFIDESGDGAVNAQESHGIRIEDCTGDIVIDGCTIDDCAETATGAGQGFDNNCISVFMDGGGTLGSLQITDCTLSGTEVATLGTTTDHGIRIELDDNSKITDCDVTGCLANDLGRTFCEVHCDVDDDGGDCDIGDLNISNNGTGANPIEVQAECINLVVNGTSTVVFHIDNNVLSDGSAGGLSSGNGVRVNSGLFGTGTTSTASMTGTINDNDIDDLGDFGFDNGIEVQVQENTTAVIEIDNNTVDGQSDDGIRVRVFDTATCDCTISNNAVGLNTVNTGDGIEVQTRSGTPSLCLNILNNNCASGDPYLMNHDAGTFDLLDIIGVVGGTTPWTPAEVDTYLGSSGVNKNNIGTKSTAAGTYTNCTTVSVP